MLNGHGDDLHLIEGKIKYNFSSNVYYKGCPSELIEAILSNINQIQNYPSPIANELNELAAKVFQLSNNQFLFTNGATEAFYLIAQLFSNKKAAIVAPTFSEYEDACKIFKLNYKLISQTDLANTDEDLVFICNPNNPDGSVFSKNELDHLFKQKPHTTFVIDEAYIEFTDSIDSIMSLTKYYSNLIVVRSLTKTFTIPGLRIGYIVSSASNIVKILGLKMPWSVNSLAIKAGEFIFNNYETLQFNVSELLKEAMVFKKQLAQLEGLQVCESNTPYFLVQLENKSAKELKEFLIKEHQILIRDATNFSRLNGEHIRLSTQSKEANHKLIHALKEWL